MLVASVFVWDYNTQRYLNLTFISLAFKESHAGKTNQQAKTLLSPQAENKSREKCLFML